MSGGFLKPSNRSQKCFLQLNGTLELSAVEKSFWEIFIGNLTSLTRGQLASAMWHCSEQSKRKCSFHILRGSFNGPVSQVALHVSVEQHKCYTRTLYKYSNRLHIFFLFFYFKGTLSNSMHL